MFTRKIPSSKRKLKADSRNQRQKWTIKTRALGALDVRLQHHSPVPWCSEGDRAVVQIFGPCGATTQVLWGRGPDGLTFGRFPLGWKAWASWETGLGDWGSGQVLCKEQDDAAFPFTHISILLLGLTVPPLQTKFFQLPQLVYRQWANRVLMKRPPWRPL